MSPSYNTSFKLKKSIHKAIVKSVSNGNWIPTASKAAGLDTRTVQQWIQIGRGEHPTKPPVEPFVTFAEDIQNRMFGMWFADNQDYFSKESFLNHVESNEWEFDEDGNLF